MDRNNLNSGSLTSSLLAEAAAAAEGLMSGSEKIASVTQKTTVPSMKIQTPAPSVKPASAAATTSSFSGSQKSSAASAAVAAASAAFSSILADEPVVETQKQSGSAASESVAASGSALASGSASTSASKPVESTEAALDVQAVAPDAQAHTQGEAAAPAAQAQSQEKVENIKATQAAASAEASAAPVSSAPESSSVASAKPAAPSSAIVTNKMPPIVEMPAIGEYLDFRKYLADYYKYRREISKKDIRPYNYAVFSAAANIKSPNYLKLIIEGRRNLSLDMISKFAKALGLAKEQTEEFRLMVLFGQATDPAERNLHLKSLNERRVDSKLKSGEIDQKTWEKIPSWITWILYSLVDQENVKFEPEKLRETLRNKANADEITAAFNSLLKTGEIVKDEKTGEIKKARSLMESAEDVPVALVRKLQAELMYLGLESLFHDGPTEREFGSATLSLTKSEFEELRFQLRKIRKETQKKIGVKRLSSKGERVYQLNLQLFPVSNKVD